MLVSLGNAMKAIIEQLGNEKGIVISDCLLDVVNLNVNDIVDVKVEGRCIVIEPAREFEYSLDELLAQCTPDAMVLCKEDKARIERARFTERVCLNFMVANSN